MAAKKKDRFEFATTSGATIALPSLKTLKPGLVRKIRNLAPADQLFTILEAVLTEDELTPIDDLDQPEFAALVEAWGEWSGVALGE